MEHKDNVKVTGHVRLQVFDNDGKLLQDTGFQKNGITNAALAVFAGLVGATGSQTAFGYLAVGTDATAFAASQTTLIAETVDTGLARVAASVSRTTTNQTNDTMQLTHTWTATGTKTINEIGVFNAASSGVMAARKLTGSVTVNNGNTLVGTYNITFS